MTDTTDVINARRMSNIEREAIENEIRKAIEARGAKPGSKRALDIESDMLVGAMLAINTLLPNNDKTKISEAIPPTWVISRMSGRSVL